MKTFTKSVLIGACGFLFTAGISILILSTSFCRAAVDAVGPRQRLSMDLNWAFTRGDPASAQSPAFDDRAWRVLDVPHDWSIEGPYAQTNSTAGSGGYLPAGIGWYRKHFTTPTSSSRHACRTRPRLQPALGFTRN